MMGETRSAVTMMTMNSDFLHSTLGRTGIPVCRLGLSGSYWPGQRTFDLALDEGVNYFFACGIDFQTVRALRGLSAGRREEVVIATGAYNFVWARQDLKKALERRLRQLGTDYIDTFHFLGVMKPKHMTPRVMDQLQELRSDPRVKAVSISCHDRKFAGQLVADGKLDCIMARYNAAHRGAESEIIPALERHGTAMISYTATRWGYLIRRSRHWPKERPIPTPGQCYRFVLSNPAVSVCLNLPSNERQFRENLAAVRLGPLPEDEMRFMREYGDVVHAHAGWFM